jgi:hypothetical protein
VPDPRDIVDIEGVPPPAANRPRPAPDEGPTRPWLGVWFRCCHVYGRMYRTFDGARYEGRCPKCLGEVGARVGPGGTARRFFTAD